jgi:hypothetical protein
VDWFVAHGGFSIENLPCAAALIGDGSEVLGFDTAMSSDPCVMVFLPEPDLNLLRDSITEALAEQLPRRFCGYPTGYAQSDAQGDDGVQTLD